MGFNMIAIGGDHSGSLPANGLLTNGAEVKLYERDAANSKRDGYQIRLGDAAIKGFCSCLKEA
jgi:hypothetical protein